MSSRPFTVLAALALVAGLALALAPSAASRASVARSVTWTPLETTFSDANLVTDGSRYAMCATDQQSDDTHSGGSFVYAGARTISPNQPFVSRSETYYGPGERAASLEVFGAEAQARVAYLLDVGMNPARLAVAGRTYSRDGVVAAIYAQSKESYGTSGDRERLKAEAEAAGTEAASYAGPYTMAEPHLELTESGGMLTLGPVRSAAGTPLVGIDLAVSVIGATLADQGTRTDREPAAAAQDSATGSGQDRTAAPASPDASREETRHVTSDAEPVEIPLAGVHAGERVEVSVVASGLPATTYEVWEDASLQDRLVTGQPSTLSARAEAAAPRRVPPAPPASTEPPAPSEPPAPPETPTPPAPAVPTEPASTLTPRPPEPSAPATARVEPPAPTTKALAKTGPVARRAGGIAVILASTGLLVINGTKARRGRVR